MRLRLEEKQETRALFESCRNVDLYKQTYPSRWEEEKRSVKE